MKNMLKNKDGYVLAYVVVVIAVVSLIAVAACTATVRNYKSQSAALAYTQEKYAAEGVVERFVAELKDAAVGYAESLVNEDGKVESVTPQELNQAITNIILAPYVDENTASGIASRIVQDNTTVQFTVYDILYESATDFSAKFQAKTDSEDENEGYAYYHIAIKSSSGGVRIDAEIKLSFEVVKGDGKATISEVMFEYTSYEVTTTAGR